jgi:ubiquinone/menaquinone biosynthesis C-methylase UbiE
VSELQHPDSRAFELVADVYERARPQYPAEAVAWLAEQLDLRAGRTVLDLGAGTGKLTRSLVETGARVIAVEPGDAMLEQLKVAVAGITALRGAAESIPLPDASVDAITVGQAFHWFRHEEAVPELRRVLRPRGGVALVWNSRDQQAPLQQEISELIAPWVTARAIRPDSSTELALSGLFGPIQERRFAFVDKLDEDGLADRIASISFVAAAPEAARRQIDADVRKVVRQHGGRVDFPYVTWVYVSRAV